MYKCFIILFILTNLNLFKSWFFYPCHVILIIIHSTFDSPFQMRIKYFRNFLLSKPRLRFCSFHLYLLTCTVRNSCRSRSKETQLAALILAGLLSQGVCSANKLMLLVGEPNTHTYAHTQCLRNGRHECQQARHYMRPAPYTACWCMRGRPPGAGVRFIFCANNNKGPITKIPAAPHLTIICSVSALNINAAQFEHFPSLTKVCVAIWGGWCSSAVK